MGYQYRGTNRQVEEIEDRRTTRQAQEFNPAKCGTYAGYKQHQNLGTKPCRDCKDAQATYRRDLEERRKRGEVGRFFSDDKCGTLSGYSRHKRLDVPVCDDCREARKEHRAAYYQTNAA